MLKPAAGPRRHAGLQLALEVLGVMLVVLCNFFLFGRTFSLDASDFLLIAWEPGQQLLSDSGVYLDYPYPLWTVVVMLPWTLSSPMLGMWLWLVFNALMIAIAVLALVELLRWPRRLLTLLLLGTMITWYLPVITGLKLGQLIFTSLAALAMLALVLIQRRWWAAGVLAGLILIKPQVLALLVGALLLWALLTRRWRLLGGFAAVAAALVAISAPFAVIPQQIVGGGVGHHLETYMAQSSSIWGLSLALAPGLWQIPLALSLLLLIWLVVLWLPALRAEPDERQWLYLISITTLVNLLIIPYSWMHNFAIMVLPLCYALSLVGRLRGPQRLAWAALLLLISHILPALIFAELTLRHHTQVHQSIPACLLLALLVVIQRKVARSAGRGRRAQGDLAKAQGDPEQAV